MGDDDEGRVADDSMDGTEEVRSDYGNADNVGDNGRVRLHVGFVLL